MWAWLLALSCVKLSSQAAMASAPVAEIALNIDVLPNVFVNLGFAGICQVSCVSRDYRKAARQAIRVFYGIQMGGKTFLNYTLLLREMDALARDMANGKSTAETADALGACPRFLCLRHVLEAQFGYCIKCVAGELPDFNLSEAYTDLLNDEHKVSVLPYILDQNIHNVRWVYLIRGLVQLGRFDLLNQMTFPTIDTHHFYELMSVPLPESVLFTAISSLKRNEPTSQIANLLAFAGFGLQVALPFETSGIPLFLLRHLHENNVELPQHVTFVEGLDESSIAFWMYVFARNAEEAEGLLQFVSKHGDSGSQHLASAFYGSVSGIELSDTERDIYQAVLIHWRFSPICNNHVIQNYESMLGKLREIAFYTTCAFIDCGKSQLVHSFGLKVACSISLEAILDKMQWSQDDTATTLVQKTAGYFIIAPRLLKHLIQRKADPAYVQLVWNLHKARLPHTIDDHCCILGLEVLERLALDRDASVSEFEEMLAALSGFQRFGLQVSREAHVLHTVMFWEAPEGVIEHFLNQVGNDYEIEHELVWRLLRLTKYSSEFSKRLVQRCPTANKERRAELLGFRPELSLASFVTDKES